VEPEEIGKDLRAVHRHGWSVSALAREFLSGAAAIRSLGLTVASNCGAVPPCLSPGTCPEPDTLSSHAHRLRRDSRVRRPQPARLQRAP
jgi:hypothetical protein